MLVCVHQCLWYETDTQNHLFRCGWMLADKQTRLFDIPSILDDSLVSVLRVLLHKLSLGLLNRW